MRTQDIDKFANKSLANAESVQAFLRTYSQNFSKIDDAYLIGTGGANAIFRLDTYLPLEVVAKVCLEEGAQEALLQENQFLRLVAHDDYICKV